MMENQPINRSIIVFRSADANDSPDLFDKIAEVSRRDRQKDRPESALQPVVVDSRHERSLNDEMAKGMAEKIKLVLDEENARRREALAEIDTQIAYKRQETVAIEGGLKSYLAYLGARAAKATVKVYEDSTTTIAAFVKKLL
jgi:hypothetical protein